jgi:drug/metabolite transporter (DMT)-like permease
MGAMPRPRLAGNGPATMLGRAMSDRTAPPTLLWTTLLPGLFVVLWSTGFIGAKMGLPYAEPFTFVALRYLFVVAIMLPVALVVRATWPSRFIDVLHLMAAGLLLHAVYIAGVFASIYHGLPAGISAMIVGLQPLLTATLVGPLLGERVSGKQWLGLLLGLVGLALVLREKLAFDRATGGAVLLAIGALFGITLGTLYQKRFCSTADMRSSAVIQFAAAGLACLAVALPLETMHVEWTGHFIFALGWLVLVLSIGTVSLLYLILRRGAAAKTASLFYLVPPATALFAWALFGETLGMLALAGMALAAVGVALVQRN